MLVTGSVSEPVSRTIKRGERGLRRLTSILPRLYTIVHILARLLIPLDSSDDQPGQIRVEILLQLVLLRRLGDGFRVAHCEHAVAVLLVLHGAARDLGLANLGGRRGFGLTRGGELDVESVDLRLGFCKGADELGNLGVEG